MPCGASPSTALSGPRTTTPGERTIQSAGREPGPIYVLGETAKRPLISQPFPMSCGATTTQDLELLQISSKKTECYPTFQARRAALARSNHTFCQYTYPRKFCKLVAPASIPTTAHHRRSPMTTATTRRFRVPSDPVSVVGSTWDRGVQVLRGASTALLVLAPSPGAATALVGNSRLRPSRCRGWRRCKP